MPDARSTDSPRDGVLLVDKPAGPTSHDVVARARRSLPRGTKVGHAGTLDPFASGLLLVLLGRATRAQRFLMDQPKAYETVARLGWTSTTGDPEGELLQTKHVPPDPPPLPTGEVRQVPPAYSAVKVGGRRAYALARAGEAVELPERVVRVHRFEQLRREDDRATFAIACSSGTYVRSLIADLHDAYCLELRRTAIGPFDVADASDRPLALADALARVLPAVTVDEERARALGHGRPADLRDLEVRDPPRPALLAGVEGPHEDAGTSAHATLVLDPAGDAVCIVEREGDLAKPRVGFRG